MLGNMLDHSVESLDGMLVDSPPPEAAPPECPASPSTQSPELPELTSPRGSALTLLPQVLELLFAQLDPFFFQILSSSCKLLVQLSSEHRWRLWWSALQVDRCAPSWTPCERCLSTYCCSTAASRVLLVERYMYRFLALSRISSSFTTTRLLYRLVTATVQDGSAVEFYLRNTPRGGVCGLSEEGTAGVIKRDVARTFQDWQMFKSRWQPDGWSAAQDALANILLAVSEAFAGSESHGQPAVQYTQGMNYVAAAMLSVALVHVKAAGTLWLSGHFLQSEGSNDDQMLLAESLCFYALLSVNSNQHTPGANCITDENISSINTLNMYTLRSIALTLNMYTLTKALSFFADAASSVAGTVTPFFAAASSATDAISPPLGCLLVSAAHHLHVSGVHCGHTAFQI